jgi:signal transduction histidine kinase
MSAEVPPEPPRKSQRGAARRVSSARSAPADGDATINILIVDDEPKNLTVLETILDDPGYRLVRAESADEALLALLSESFAVLILDIRMPGMTGFELAEIIKQRKRTAHVPIIFLTAYYNEDQHVLEGYDTGAVDYLHKPVNPQILRSKVAVFAELYRKSQDAASANRALTAEVVERRRAEEQLREINDTLEQRVAERTKELAQANRLKDEFLAMLSHELRNPLSAITNAVQMIDPSGAAGDRSAWALGLIDRQSKTLRRIVDDLLDVARVARGKIELRKEPVDLLEVVSHAADVVRPVLSSDEELEVVLPATGPLRIDADFTRLEQSVVNLLLNAVKFSSPGRRIKMTVEGADGDATVSIRDNGIGIAPEMLARIFELFTQADRSLDRIQGGLGIGLYICRQLIELHGGNIAAHSDGVGHGALFTIRLPLLRHVEQGVPRRVTPRARAAEPTTTKRVLVVDDNVDAAVALSWLIGQRGYSVRVAHDGSEALQTARDFKPDILLLDLGLPGIDGYELARRLRADGFASARIIAISGYARESDVESARRAGFDHHFAKPVEFTQLVAALE